MRKETPFTVEQAKLYITDSIKVWETSGIPTDINRIISLAGHAYNQRNRKATGSDAAKIKAVKKTIRSLELTIKRNKPLGITIDLYENEITRLTTWVKQVEATLPPKVDKKNPK